MTSSKRVLVVGATGTNGQQLISQLINREIPVRALVRNKKRFKGDADKVELIEGDLNDKNSIVKALTDIHTAYIVTAIHQDSVLYYSNFFEAVKSAGVKNVIKISALGADINSVSEILRQHAESDQALIETGLNYAILRPNSFFQNLLWEARQIKRRGKFSLPLGNAKQTIVDVRDIAEVTANLCEKNNLDSQIYELTGPESLTYQEVASHLTKVLDKEVKYIPITSEVSEQGMKSIGMAEWNTRVLSELQKLFAAGVFSKSSEDLKQLLGRAPRKFSQFAMDYSSQF